MSIRVSFIGVIDTPWDKVQEPLKSALDQFIDLIESEDKDQTVISSCADGYVAEFFFEDGFEFDDNDSDSVQLPMQLWTDTSQN